jgi:hypothetical protein
MDDYSFISDPALRQAKVESVKPFHKEPNLDLRLVGQVEKEYICNDNTTNDRIVYVSNSDDTNVIERELKEALDEKDQALLDKQQAEQKAQLAEQTAKQAEHDKQQAEQKAQQAEQEKQQAEEAAKKAAEEKQQAEQKAKQTEQEKQQAEQKAKQAEQEKQRAEAEAKRLQHLHSQDKNTVAASETAKKQALLEKKQAEEAAQKAATEKKQAEEAAQKAAEAAQKATAEKKRTEEENAKLIEQLAKAMKELADLGRELQDTGKKLREVTDRAVSLQNQVQMHKVNPNAAVKFRMDQLDRENAELKQELTKALMDAENEIKTFIAAISGYLDSAGLAAEPGKNIKADLINRITLLLKEFTQLAVDPTADGKYVSTLAKNIHAGVTQLIEAHKKENEELKAKLSSELTKATITYQEALAAASANPSDGKLAEALDRAKTEIEKLLNIDVDRLISPNNNAFNGTTLQAVVQKSNAQKNIVQKIHATNVNTVGDQLQKELADAKIEIERYKKTIEQTQNANRRLRDQNLELRNKDQENNEVIERLEKRISDNEQDIKKQVEALKRFRDMENEYNKLSYELAAFKLTTSKAADREKRDKQKQANALDEIKRLNNIITLHNAELANMRESIRQPFLADIVKRIANITEIRNMYMTIRKKLPDEIKGEFDIVKTSLRDSISETLRFVDALYPIDIPSKVDDNAGVIDVLTEYTNLISLLLEIQPPRFVSQRVDDLAEENKLAWNNIPSYVSGSKPVTREHVQDMIRKKGFIDGIIQVARVNDGESLLNNADKKYILRFGICYMIIQLEKIPTMIETIAIQRSKIMTTKEQLLPEEKKHLSVADEDKFRGDRTKDMNPDEFIKYSEECTDRLLYDLYNKNVELIRSPYIGSAESPYAEKSNIVLWLAIIIVLVIMMIFILLILNHYLNNNSTAKTPTRKMRIPNLYPRSSAIKGMS